MNTISCYKIVKNVSTKHLLMQKGYSKGVFYERANGSIYRQWGGVRERFTKKVLTLTLSLFARTIAFVLNALL